LQCKGYPQNKPGKKTAEKSNICVFFSGFCFMPLTAPHSPAQQLHATK